MARGKKGRKVKPESVAAEKTAHSVTTAESTENHKTRRFYWWDYVCVGLFFVAFCELQKHFGVWMIGADDTITKSNVEVSALNFLYGTMWKGFLVVLLLVWIYDYFYHDAEEDTT